MTTMRQTAVFSAREERNNCSSHATGTDVSRPRGLGINRALALLICSVLFIVGATFPVAGTSSGGANLAHGDEAAKAGDKAKGRENRLARETSPYLLLHAHNPVDWYPWGPEALEKAKKEQKLIFLSVGYSSCYWCHVMERKVFMNETIAKTMNENFVCIKVDREERPDIDDIYMTSLQVYYQAIGAPSSGGWPLSMFLTPDGKPVAGGTYFPPEDTDGNMGFSTVLRKLTDLWKNNREQLETNANTLANETRRVMRPKLALKPVEVNDALIAKAFDGIAATIDPDFGGVDFNPQRPEGPKFPTPTKLLFLQQQLKRQPNEDVAKLLDLTLTQLAAGGIRDHVGGGFHRYSVDRKWYVPHFEKMLYDQAQLSDVYINAYLTTKNPLYRQVAEELLTFVQREMTSSEGGFFAALDAETNGIEGEYYVWEAREINTALGAAADLFKETYRVKDLSDFEHGNVLRLNPNDIQKFDADTLKQLAECRTNLLKVRNRRQRPLRDEKILSGWNGLMIGAFARAGLVFKDRELVETAERAATFLLANLRDGDGRLLRTHTAGKARLPGYLEDYAYVIEGLLALNDASPSDERWLKSALDLQEEQLRSFRDQVGGAFYFTSHHHEELLARTKNCYDGVLPAGNSVSARNLIKLTKLTKEKRYLDEARTVVELFASSLEQTPRGLSILALAASELLAAEGKSNQSATRRDDAILLAGGADPKDKSAEPLVPAVTDPREDKVKKEDLIRAQAYLSTDRLEPGKKSAVVVILDVKEGWHINQNPADPDNLKPTTITFKSTGGVTMSEAKYPRGHEFDLAGDKAMVYEGEVQIRGVIDVPASAAGTSVDVEIAVAYQACNDKGCRPPKTIKLTGKVPVARQGEPVKAINMKLFSTKGTVR